MEPGPLRRRRAAAQLLAGRGGSTPTEVVERLLAVQAQDPRAARLALRARGTGFAAADVDRALDDGSLVAGWLGRGTLHLVRREDYPWLLALTAPASLPGSRRRLRQEGVPDADAERAVRVIGRALADEGPLTRAELGARLRSSRIAAEGQALPHLLGLAALRGVAVLGPLREGRPAFALARDRLGIEPALDLGGEERERALGELARRYLAGHGPALPADLAAWAGVPLRDARTGLRSAGAALAELDGGLVDLAGRKRAPARVPPRLVPAFDPYLLGWKDRSFAVPPEHARCVHPGGGVLRPAALVDGRAVGTWSLRRRGVRRSLDLRLFADVPGSAADGLERERADLLRFEGAEPPPDRAPAR